MEFGKPFSFPFQDPDWLKKIAINALVSIIPMYGLGWGLEVTRRVIRGEAETIPDMDIGTYFMRGLKAAVVYFVYVLPLMLFYLPIALIPVIAMAVVGNSKSAADTVGLITTITMVCCGGLMGIYYIFMMLMLPAAITNFVAKDSIGAGLRFGEVFGILKAAPVAFILALVGAALAGIIGSLGSIACGIGSLFTMAYAMLIIGHFYGQAYRQATAKVGY